jgi:hypothetical protein
VQALLEPDLLIVDEALAVGDAAFQIKCVHRMRQLIARGTAVILVSHDVNAVRQFCERVVWLHDGEVKLDGKPMEVTSRYVQFLFEQQHVPLEDETRVSEPPARAVFGADEHTVDPQLRRLTNVEERPDLVRWGSGELRAVGAALDNGTPGGLALEHGGALCIELAVEARQDLPSRTTSLAFSIRNTKGLDLIAYTTWEAGQRFTPWRAGQTRRIRFTLDNILAPGEYALTLAAEDVRAGTRHYYDYVENALIFRVNAAQPIFSVILPRVRHELLLADTDAP